MIRACRLLQLNIAIFVLLVSSISGVAIAADTPSPSPIANPIIDTDRSRTPEGKLTIAVHVSLSPKWLNPQEIPAIMAYELLWKLHDNMIQADPQHLYSYALADFYEMSPDLKTATVRLRPGVKFHTGEAITSEDV
jgi:peptide/nickel transport system substrate-binding protein